MSDPNDSPQPEADRSASPGRRSSGGTFMVWTVILVLTLLVAGAPAPTPEPVPVRGRLHEAALTLQARYLVGSASLAEQRALGLAGFVVLVVFLSLLFAGVLPTLQPSRQPSGVYAEGFACWLALFLGLSVAGGVLFGAEAVGAVGFLSMIGSLAAFAWPVARGVSWEQLREDIGWTPGRHWGLELAAGVGGYAMAIPLVLLALAVTGIALGFGNGGMEYGSAPSHPAAEWLAQGGWWQRVQLLLLACIIAPIVEESAFRGLLYRHLRDASAGMHRGTSVVLSALVSSVLFALLHPQGLLAVPALMGISVALAFTREWRKTLIPSMVAHGLNNAVVMAVLLTVLGE